MTLAAPLSHDTVTNHEHIGFELGWDFAHYNVHLPASRPLRSGEGSWAYGAGRCTL